MRERLAGDWLVDLTQRHRLEDSVARAIDAHRQLSLVTRSTNAFDSLDYTCRDGDHRMLAIELKAKHQPYAGWQELRPEVDESNLFICDERAMRAILAAGRYAFLLVADVPSKRWCVYSATDLALASKVRAVRPLANRKPTLKAKILFDLSEAAVRTRTLRDAIRAIVALAASCDTQYSSIAPWPHGPPIVNLRKWS
jgi:hypothetical protein